MFVEMKKATHSPHGLFRVLCPASLDESIDGCLNLVDFSLKAPSHILSRVVQAMISKGSVFEFDLDVLDVQSLLTFHHIAVLDGIEELLDEWLEFLLRLKRIVGGG